MELELVDEGPPPPGEKWAAVANELRSHGEWRTIRGINPNSASGFASLIRKGGMRAFEPAGAFDADGRRGKLRARYVGPTQEDAGPATP